MLRVVLDTSVLVAAARSRRGASFALVDALPSTRFQTCLSVPLYAEWQDVLTRSEHLPAGLTSLDALAALRALAAHAWLQDIYFLWRPFCAIRKTTWFWSWLWQLVAATLSRTTRVPSSVQKPSVSK